MFKKLILPIVILVVLIIAGLIWWQSGPEPPKGPKTTGLPMKIARYYWPGEYWIEIADKKGWFKEAGLNVEIIDTNPDYFASIKDMVAGRMDMNNFYLFDFISFIAKGSALVMVINSDTSFGVDAIVAKQEIENIQGLKGKTIATTKGTYLEYILGMALNRSNLTLDDVVIVDMPGETVAEEFIKGTVDAIVTWEPEVSKAIEKGSGRKLFDTSEIPGISPNGGVFHRSFIEKRPGDVQAFVNVWHKTTKFIKENPKEAFSIIAGIYKKTPGEVQALAQIDKILDLQDNLIAFSYSTGFESLHGAAYKINDFMLKKGITDKQLDSLEFLDDQFIRALQRERVGKR